MASNLAREANLAREVNGMSVADAQLRRVATVGLAGHGHAAALAEGRGAHATRDLSDAVHLLCQVYGRHPGLLELALGHCPAGPVRDWLRGASDAFERERLFLVRLTAAVGPMPSTPGHPQTEAALVSQRHALETLARSERGGCALGATTALVGDWPAIRAVMVRAADRAGMAVPASTLPDAASVIAVIGHGAASPASERALGFGGEQLLLQNRGLFDLLEARVEARGDY